jgi:ABC-type transport system substrate-binding protein
MEALGFPTISTLAFQATWLPEAGPTHDIRIRQALSYALNRQEICDTWYQGYAKPGGQFFMHRGCWGWTDDLIPDEYDPDKAHLLMAQAGYPQDYADPTITLYTTAATQDYMLVILGYWDAAGFQTHLEIVDIGVYWGMLFARPQPGDRNVGWIWPWTSGSFFNCTYHSANMYTSRGIHGTSNDAKATEMYDDYIAETDMAKAEQKWADFQKYVKTLYISFGIAEVEPKMPVAPTLGEFAGRNWIGIQEAYSGIQQP